MEKEYEQDENYIKLSEELNIIKKKREQLKEIYNNLIERDKKIANEIDSMYDEIELLESNNNNLLEEETDKLRKKSWIIAILVGLSIISLFTSALLEIKDIEMNQIIKLALVIVCEFGLLPIPLTLGMWLQSKLENKYVTEKKQELNNTKEYSESLSRIENLNQEIEKKELQADKLSARIYSISERINNFSFDICMREINLQSKFINPHLKEKGIVKKESAHIYLPEDGREIKPKTKALVKPNN